MFAIKPRTIYTKGLILIAVPLLVEVIFGITMFNLQHYYETKLNRERTAIEIIFHANDMWVECSELLYLKGYYNFFGGRRPNIEERMARLMSAYRSASALVADDPGQSENLEEIWANTNRSLEVGNKLVPLAEKSHSASGKMAALSSNLDTIAQAESYLSALGKPLQSFRKPEFLQSDAAIPEVERSTALVDRVVLGSLAGSTLVALLLFTYFIRSIKRGVSVVLENTERFRKGLELKPPVSGGDELAQVDTALHGMADEIKEAQRTKQAILSMISHDLRSPLTSIDGYLLNLEDGLFGDITEETVSEAGKCERDIQKLIQLINDLLDLDKIEAGRFELRAKSLLACDAIERAIAAVAPVAEEGQVTVEGTEGSAEIYADPERIVQALANVLSLFVRLSSPGSRVETFVAQSDGEAEIRVHSASASITQNHLDSLFDRYQQSEDGLRLELPMSKEIVRLHGGTIAAQADPAQGLTCWLRLPRYDSVPLRHGRATLQ